MTFDPARALPNAAYRDQAFHEAETAGIWHGDWVFATTTDAVKSTGDQLPLVVGEQPVLLLRNQQGELRALSNLCAHRGTLLVERPANSKRIQCPYHAWTYNDSGRLLAAPFAPRDAIDKTAHCLPEYRVESWHGLVFVSLSPDVEPLAERFSAVESAVTERGIDELHHYSDQQETHLWNCNWKLAMLNAMESYHLFQVHPKTLEPRTPTNGAYYITGSALATATGGRVEGGEDYLLISLPPNFVGVLSEGTLFWQTMHPRGVNQCSVRTGGAYSTPTRSSVGWLSKLFAWTQWASYSLPDFLPEDKAICERGQRGATGNFMPGRLVPLERVVADFGHYLNWRINNVEPPAVHTEDNP